MMDFFTYNAKMGLFRKSCNNIINIYNQMYQLDINNKRNTQDYLELLYKLKLCVKNEKNLYKNECTNYADLNILLNGLGEQDKFSGVTDFLSNSDMEKSLDSRIYNKLIERFETDASLMEIVNEIIKNDDANLFLYLLSKEPFVNNEIKEKISRIKYNVAFFDCSMEKLLINRNFNCDDSVYIVYKYFCKKNGFDVEAEFIESIKKEVEKLQKITNLEYKENSKICTSIILSCHIKSMLALNNSNCNQLLNNINNDESYSISYNIIKKIFSETPKTKQEMKIITNIKRAK